MTAESYPLQWPHGWPRTPYGKQERGDRFTRTDFTTGSKRYVSFANARDGLYDELRRLGARNVVVSTNHKPDRFGIPVESKRSVGDEGVAVYFTLRAKTMAMACDRFTYAAANMRSLALAIEAMRQLDRHGGGTMMERAFSGFAALTAPGKNWWDVLQVRPDASTEAIEANFRRLARDRHPDRGGTNAAMAELNEARAAGLASRT